MSVPRRGAFAAFADPRLPAERAHPLWLPETGAARLHFTAQPIGESAGDRLGLRISAFANVEHVLCDAAGRQHAVLRSGARSVQFVITGDNAIIAPVALSVVLRGSHDIGPIVKELADLKVLLSAKPSKAGEPPRWTAETMRLRDALIALDGDRAGATLREIAIVIYGRERIERDWPGKGLERRLRRDLQRGQALCNAGYRNLIR
jgi:hypothetical protein